MSNVSIDRPHDSDATSVDPDRHMLSQSDIWNIHWFWFMFRRTLHMTKIFIPGLLASLQHHGWNAPIISGRGIYFYGNKVSETRYSDTAEVTAQLASSFPTLRTSCSIGFLGAYFRWSWINWCVRFQWSLSCLPPVLWVIFLSMYSWND
jgi:hypothetical protein